jgi:hypothetical protein
MGIYIELIYWPCVNGKFIFLKKCSLLGWLNSACDKCADLTFNNIHLLCNSLLFDSVWCRYGLKNY